ncbi:chitinase domain-containing protein 1 [Toxorhynchites rutilus septentrionalis]|uniref:chitinase domain-containing protein 1 n=1 Tax=Toxorhynchites rutilus septentrionalis TaxID=329112 RepID=UPI00247866AD|nr:chitinase domain-containing protein 1 [Toxorhynchites rutilus septentrionalis]
MKCIYSTIFLALCIVQLAGGTLSPSDVKNKGKKVKELKVKKGPQPSDVFDRGLMEEEPSAKSILVESGTYYEETALKSFKGTVLGYVTPWNNHGYDVAKTWGAKFNYVSPVWLQVLRKGPKLYELGGAHDIDAGWIKDVKKAGETISNKVVPRILFDKFTDKDFSQLLTYSEERTIAAKLILDTVREYQFDGIVLEVWSQLSARVEDAYLIELVTEICQTLTNSNYDCILVIPPARKETYDLFSRQHFETLAPIVTAFSLMTYDFSNLQRPGANAPLYWVKNAVQHICPDTTDNLEQKRAKILLGLNFYGSDFTPNGGQPIVGHEYLALLKHLKGHLTLDEHDGENFFEVRTTNGRHMVFYPTLYSINERLKLARELGTGISIWELGQGLDYFYDLF